MTKDKLKAMLAALAAPYVPRSAAEVLEGPVPMGTQMRATEEVADQWIEVEARGVRTGARREVEMWARARRIENAQMGGRCEC